MNIDNRYTSLAEEIRQLLLEALIEGRLVPGTRINDIELAQKLGVSRTPVREALRGLQSAGIIETLPARITRVIKLTGEEFEHAKTVWSALYRLLLTDTVHKDKDNDNHIDTMVEMRDRFEEEPESSHAEVSFRFFDALSHATDNRFLRESLRIAACRLRLGHESDGVYTHVRPSLAQAQAFLDALDARDLKAAHEHFTKIVGPTTRTPDVAPAA